MPITIILYRTENSENLGSIARAASNFGFDDIILIEPQCDVDGKSRNLAKHGQPTLNAMRREPVSVLDAFDTLIMTHGRASDEYNMVRAPMTPRQLSERLLETGWSQRKIGIVFGPEGEGLLPDMLRRADIAVAIPTVPKNPSMNLAQSVTVILYELSLLGGKRGKITEKFKPSTALDRDIVLKLADECLDQMTWPNPKRKETQRLIWRRMIGRAMLTRREAATVMGFLKRVRGKK